MKTPRRWLSLRAPRCPGHGECVSIGAVMSRACVRAASRRLLIGRRWLCLWTRWPWPPPQARHGPGKTGLLGLAPHRRAGHTPGRCGPRTASRSSPLTGRPSPAHRAGFQGSVSTRSTPGMLESQNRQIWSAAIENQTRERKGDGDTSLRLQVSKVREIPRGPLILPDCLSDRETDTGSREVFHSKELANGRVGGACSPMDAPALSTVWPCLPPGRRQPVSAPGPLHQLPHSFSHFTEFSAQLSPPPCLSLSLCSLGFYHSIPTSWRCF